MFQNPDASLDFTNAVRHYLSQQGATVFLDLGPITDFRSDALLLVRAVMDSPFRIRPTSIAGNLPTSPNVAAEFKASGFFDGIAKPPANLPPAQGLMLKRSDNTVHAKVAAQLINFAKTHNAIDDATANASYRTLVELMTNTHNHAHASVEQRRPRPYIHERWSASVYCLRNQARFAFLDLGVGILYSAPARQHIRLTRIPVRNDKRIQLLSDVFIGRLGSATRKPGRGRGLPAMREEAQRGRLLDLEILTSNVIGSVADLDFRCTGRALSGTSFRWRSAGRN